MSKNNRDFFERKSEWASVKDELLECYLAPYVSKILMTGRPLLYVDCFAGKGKFDDGKEGSPLIASRIIERCLTMSRARSPKAVGLFIDKEYSEELEKNLPKQEYFIAVSGTFEETSKLLSKYDGYNVNLFLYIDPYGISSLDMGFFDGIVKRFPSVELLINLNTFGFFREACRVYGVEYADVDSSDEFLLERDAWEPGSESESESRLSIIAGGDYWKCIVDDYRRDEIDGYTAEKRFATEFCKRLMESYRYALHFPIRIKTGNRPKYRMVHATNHSEGATLMYENMYGRKELLITQIQRAGQMSIFDESVENEYIDMEELKAEFKAHVLSHMTFVGDHELLASFIVRKGVLCPLKEYRDVLREMEDTGEIIVIRDPARTEKGNPTSFFESKGKRRLFIRGA